MTQPMPIPVTAQVHHKAPVQSGEQEGFQMQTKSRLQVQSNIYFIKKLVAYHLVRLEDRRRKFIPANMYGYDTLTRRYPPERWEIVPDYTVDVGDERRPHVWLERDLPWSDWLEKRKLYMKPV